MLDLLRRQLFIPILDRRRGVLASRFSREVGQILMSSRAAIGAYQERRYREMALHAFRTVPFYRQHYKELADGLTARDQSKLRVSLPPIDKSHIRNAKDELLSSEFSVSSLRRSATGGTTSSPIEFFLDDDSYSRRQACTRFFMGWYGIRPGDKMAYLWGAPCDFPEGLSLKWHIINFLTYRTLILPSSFLNDETMSEYHRRLRRFAPQALQAYPTALFVFARFLLTHGLSIPIPSITVTAEPLLPQHRETIEAAFSTKVFNWYGARELGHAASECQAHAGMHINAYGLMFEVLRSDGSIASEGSGELLVTDLHNYSMPLIRYRIGDMGVLSNRSCPCGSHLPMLESVTGRVADVFRRRDGTMVPGISLADRVMTECSGIKEFQVIQDDFESFTLRVAKGEDFSTSAIEEFKARVRTYMGTELSFRIEFVESIPRERSGKIRFCVSRL